MLVILFAVTGVAEIAYCADRIAYYRTLPESLNVAETIKSYKVSIIVECIVLAAHTALYASFLALIIPKIKSLRRPATQICDGEADDC